MIFKIVDIHLDRSKLFDLGHCNAVVEKVMAECSSDDEFVSFGKVLYGRHGWGVAAKHYIQIEQLKARGAPPDIVELALRGKIDEARVKFGQFKEAVTVLNRVKEIKARIEEINI